MTTNNKILVQNIETFETITICDNDDAFDAYMENNDSWGIVSLEDDADGEYAAVALLAPAAGPDFVMDMDTGEMEPVEKIDPNVELECKLDIALEIDEPETMSEWTCGGVAIPVLKINGQTQAEFEASKTITSDEDEVVIAPIAFTPPKTKSRKTRNKSKKSNTSTGAKMKAHEHLVALITSNPGISRTDVFTNKGLRAALLSSGVIAKIDAGDKLETKRWNRRLNRFIRQMRRDGTDINIERVGRVAQYTIGTPSGQLELPFSVAAEARNSAIIGNDAADEELAAPVKIDFRRSTEPANVEMSFDDLLATLDDEAVADVPTEKDA